MFVVERIRSLTTELAIHAVSCVDEGSSAARQGEYVLESFVGDAYVHT